jgi:hypothetical protein
MSIHSTEDFDPTSSTPIFGGTVSQTKIQQQQQPINDLGGAEKLITPPQPVVNGQNETTNGKSSDNLGNGTEESVNGNHSTTDTTAEHVNGQNGDTISAATEPASSSTTATDSTEKLSENETNNSVSVVTEPAVSTTSDTGKKEVSSAPLTVADNAPPVPVISNETTSTSNEDVPAPATAPEATVLAESSTKPTRQSKVIVYLSN